MNSSNSPMSWVSIVVLISLLLFKGVAAAAMLCCGPEHSAHSELQSGHSQSPVAEHHQVDHSAMGHNMANHSSVDQDQLAQTTDAPVDLHQHGAAQLQNDEHQSSCSGCAVSCAAAVLMLNPAERLAEQAKTERIFSFTPFVFPLTIKGLERPPRFYS
jgi:hypothetical protein